MKSLKFKSIRGHLTYWFLLLSLIPLLLALIITYFQRAKNIETTSYDKLTAIRDLKVTELTGWMDERIGDMHVMAGDYEIRSLEGIFEKKSKSDSDDKKIAIAEDLFKRNVIHYKVYDEIFFISAKTGLIEISTNPEFIGQSKSQNSYFTVPLETGDVYIKDIYHSHETHKNVMAFSIPVFCMSYDAHIIGVLVGRINLGESLYKLLGNTVGLGKTGETLIVNKDGLALNELRWNNNAMLNLQITAKPAVNASKGYTGITKTLDYRNEKVLAAYTYIPITGWGFVCKQDMKEINEPIREMIMNFVILFVFSGIVISFIALIISRSISKPIIAMNNVAKKIKAGDFSARNIITSKGELGSLALEFNNMAEITESKIIIQQGISDISKTMIGKSNMQDFGASLLKRLMKITNANMSTFYILNEALKVYEPFASVGANEKMISSFSADNPQGEFGNVLSTQKIFYLKNIPPDTIFNFKTVAGEAIPKEIITIPIVVEEIIIAIISLVNIQIFNPECMDILNQSWPNINTSYSNLIAGERTRVLAEHLTQINHQLETQSEELQQQTIELQQQTEELQNQSEELHQTSEELQRQNIELEAQRKKVEAATKLKSEFLSNMSHELRTPLNSIMALSRVLIMQTQNKLNKEEKNYLEIVERNGKRLLALINDILDLSKIEAGKMDVTPKMVSIELLLQTLKENIYTLSEEKGLSINIAVQKQLPKVETDEQRLHQALLNIIGNAVKFTEKGSIDISIKHNKEIVFIEVKDSGIGIAKEELPYIFDEFRQADGTSSRQFEGTGLGLAISKKMIAILGGKIEVSSTLGKGSTFTIIIPVNWHGEAKNEDNELLNIKSKYNSKHSVSKKNTPNKKHGTEELAIIGDELEENPGNPRDKLPHILIIDNDTDNIRIIKAILKGQYQVSVAYSKSDGLLSAKINLPHLILLEASLPEMIQGNFIEQLADDSKTRSIPVIAITTKAMKRDKEHLLDSGCKGYIPKPIAPKLLLSEIKRLLEHN